jgi:molybdopterin synthase catalytic subunit
MTIEILFFGVLKDLTGKSRETITLPEGSKVREVLIHYAREAPALEKMLPSLAISVNREYAEIDRPLRQGDEVALLPPVSGGTTNLRKQDDDQTKSEIRIAREPIDAAAIKSRLQRPSDGALVIFDGVVRDNSRGRRTLYLDYEAYESMALQQMQSLAAEARQRFLIRAASIVHRLGKLQIGDTSVLIAVASAHRAAAFDACHWIVDTLKKTVPIWKKEYFEDGAVWADGEPFPEEIQRSQGIAGAKPASK